MKMLICLATLALCCAALASARADFIATPPWHLERAATSAKLTAHVTLGIACAGAMTDGIALIASPPALPCQDHATAHLTIDDKPAGSLTTEDSPLRRKIILAHFADKKGVTLGADFTADLYRYKIAPGAPKSPVPDLPPKESANALRAADNFDFDTPAFRAYVAARDLIWHRGEEDQSAFIERAAKLVEADFAYYDGPQDRHASALVESRKGDCGAINGVLVAAMRRNKIPACLWAGFRLLNFSHTAFQPHVIAAVFVQGHGWLPVDLVSGDKVVYAMSGDNNAIFVLHIDNGITLNPPHFGALKCDWLQPFAFWYHGDPVTVDKNCEAVIKAAGSQERTRR